MGHSVSERMGVRACGRDCTDAFGPTTRRRVRALVPTCAHSHLGPFPLGPVPTYMRGLLLGPTTRRHVRASSRRQRGSESAPWRRRVRGEYRARTPCGGYMAPTAQRAAERAQVRNFQGGYSGVLDDDAVLVHGALHGTQAHSRVLQDARARRRDRRQERVSAAAKEYSR